MAGKIYDFIHCSFEGEQFIGFIAFLASIHLVPPWLAPPSSVSAAPLLPPVTPGISAKLWLAKPYGRFWGKKDQTERLYISADPVDTFCKHTFPFVGFSHSLCVWIPPSEGGTLFGDVMRWFFCFQILLGVFFILVALLLIVALFISK